MGRGVEGCLMCTPVFNGWASVMRDGGSLVLHVCPSLLSYAVAMTAFLWLLPCPLRLLGPSHARGLAIHCK